MFEHHTKNKGDLGVLKAKLDLFEKGYLTLVPETEHAPFDLVIYKDGVFKTVQVKYRAATDGKISVPFKTNWADRNGTHVVLIDKDVVDLYCVYCPDTDTCYYLKPSDFNNEVTLRVETPKNNQKTGIHLASDYLKVP